MSVTREQFEAMVAREEALARSEPAAHRRRVIGFAALGYGYLLGMLLLLVALLVGAALSVTYLKFLGVKLVLIVAPIVWLVGRALWIRLHPPQGIEVKREQAPELFAKIDALRAALEAPRFHRVLITDELNAAVVQVPRLGVFGWQQNWLVIGMPLMKALTPLQLEAVLAHEFGHLAGGHAAFSSWLYRLRLAWSNLLGALHEARSGASMLFRRFFEWYVPRFNACTFPLARAQEYEADAVAARLTTPAACAQALTGVEVVASYFGEKYWPSINEQADRIPQPSFTPFTDFGAGLSVELESAQASLWLDRALKRPTDCADTHPGLSDRLQAIGHAPQLALPEAGASADFLLGESRTAFIDQLDVQWQTFVAPHWSARHEEIARGRARLAELAERGAAQTLLMDDALERARLERDVGEGATAAMSQLRDLLAREPDNAVVNFMLGSLLLDADDESGVERIRHAMTLDPEAATFGSEALRDFYWKRGDHEQARLHHTRVEDESEIDAAAADERRDAQLTDMLAPHELPLADINRIRQMLEESPKIRRAWLVKKLCRNRPERPSYLFGFSCHAPLTLFRKSRVLELQEHIVQQPSLPAGTLVFCVDGDNQRFRKKLKKVANSRIK